ncbi:MAG: alanine racemase [Candidatus Pacebacteria bacterium]|nr:alanine racemase [Candidatus Paceibacterota bacterium]
MKGLLTWLSRRRYPYQPLITVTISRRRIVENLHRFMEIAPKHTVAPVLKSNAYGHGLIEVAKILEMEHRRPTSSEGIIPFFVIDSYFEALALRAAGIRTPLLVIGYTRPEIIAHARLRGVSFAITSIDTLRHVVNFQPSLLNLTARTRISVHLKIDTGMRRQGILPEELSQLGEILRVNPSIVVTGICSHLSDADNADPSSTESQLAIWNEVVKKLTAEYTTIKHIHISNTDGHRFAADAHATLSRLGIGLYGIADAGSIGAHLRLEPALRMDTIITGIKKLKRDETVGYGNTFKAESDMTIATIPVGYYEGIDRRLSNIGTVLVGPEDVPCPILGRVSMNITVIDVTHVPDAEIGMKATAISDDPDATNSIVNMAKKCKTIPYEIAVHIPGQLKRVVN